MTDVKQTETPIPISEIAVESPQVIPQPEVQTEKQLGLLYKIKERLKFWRQKTLTRPNEVIEEVSTVDVQISEQEPVQEIFQEKPLTGELLANEKVYYDTGGYKNEISEDNEPTYNWRELWTRQQKSKGIENPDPTSETWNTLHTSMREAIVLNHYVDEIASFAKQTSPDDWAYVLVQSKGFNVVKNSNFAEVHEGSDFIGINPEALMADVKSGDNDRKVSAFARIVHEAKHIEQNKYLDGSLPLPEGADPNLAEKTFNGYMEREKSCWKTEESLYIKLTGKPPEKVWEDQDVQEGYQEDYSKYKNIEPTAKTVEQVGKEIVFEDLPPNIREQASFFLGSVTKVEEIQSTTNEKSYSLAYQLEDVDNLFPDQIINAEVVIQENQVTGKSLGNIYIKVNVNGQSIDLSQIKNKESATEVRWAGGIGNSRRTDKVVVNENNIPDVKLDRLKTTFDFISYLHESTHTKQPIELLIAADTETDLKTKAYYSKAMEDDAWNGTRNAITQLGLAVNNQELEKLITSFESEYKLAYRAALRQEDFDNLPEYPTIEDALKLLETKSKEMII